MIAAAALQGSCGSTTSSSRRTSGTDTGALTKHAADARVEYRSGSGFFANGGGDEFARLAFSYESVEKCYEGARAFATAIRHART